MMERKCANCGNAAWKDGKTPITDVCIQCRCVDVDGRPQPSNWKSNGMTNADRIRAMSDEELAWVLMEFRFDALSKANGSDPALPNTQKKIYEWLNQPMEGK